MNPTLTFITGPPGSGKTRQLVQQALTLYQQGVPSGQVLILSSSHIRQVQCRQRLLSALTRPVQELSLYTYTGFARNTLLNIWPLAETKLQSAFLASDLTVITPDMVGVEDSEALLRHLLSKTLANTPNALEPLGQSTRATVNQLIRRQRIRSEHRITKPVFAAHDTTLELPCLDVVHPLESVYDSATLRLRWLDGSRQLDVFHGLLEREPWVLDWLATTYPYILVDDGDESTPAQQAFLQALLPRCQGAWLASDPHGGSRQGYLNAAPKRWQTLCDELAQSNKTPPQTVELARPGPQPDPLLTLADAVAHNWHQRSQGQAPTLLSPTLVHPEPPAVCWLAMVDQSLAQLAEFLATGGQPGQLVWVVPDANLLTLAPWRFGLDRARIPYQILSGVQRPSANPLARAWALMFQLLNAKAWAMPLAGLEFAPILATVLGWQHRAPKAIAPMAYWLGPSHQQAVWQGSSAILPTVDAMPFDEDVPPPCRDDVRQWAEWMQQHQDRPATEQWWALYDRWIAPAIKADDDGHALQQLHRSFERHGLLSSRLNTPAVTAFAPWIVQVKAGVAADSPAVPEHVDPQALIIGTPQKVVDYEIRRPHQWWLDASNPQWHRTDEAPLYHMGLHANPNPVASKPTPEDTDQQRADRAGAITRLLIGHLPAVEPDAAEPPLRVFSAELDGQGTAQTGWLPGVLSVEGGPVASVRRGLSIPTLRSDQAPILAYTGGTMAISAVPGAGKTFVNVALILDRIAQGTSPESILVLTYMESAARTLQGRLKPILEAAGYNTLPVISTIHALALRLISDAPPPHGLPPEVSIIDDITSEQLIKQVASQTQPPATAQANDVKDWARLLQSLLPHAKSLQLAPEALMSQRHETLVALGRAMAAYRSALHGMNAVDFTDLIVGAVRVLEQDEPYRVSVQQRFALIIEDEAQDSSLLMQRFLSLLGGEAPHLIRTGDTNQSITTTFSTADTSVFRQFIEQAQTRVTMTQSGRCAPPIIDLANHWMVASAQTSPALADAFVPVAMVPVPGQNPTVLEPIQALVFETQTEERQALIETLTRWQSDHPGASIAVLVRTNPQALEVAATLQQAGLPTVCFSQERQASVVLPVVVAWLRVLAAPQVGAHRVALLNQLASAGCYGLAERPVETLAQWRDFIAASPLFHLPLADLPTGAEALAQMVFDWRDWQRTADTPDLPQVLARMGERLFTGVLDRSNAYLVALQAQQFLRQRLDGAPTDWAMAAPQALSILEAVIGFFEEALRSRKNLKQFTQEALGYVPQAGMVQVMTLHKSKGQEFEFVSMPFLTARNHPGTVGDRKLKDDEQLTVLLNQLAATGRLDHGGEAIAQGRARFLQAILEEEARLVYVGITRARRGLVLSTHLQGRNAFGRPEKQTPALAWQVCSQYLVKA
jgi:DNA helicase II / ATP-dependent DNA helicase PcrA